MYDSQAIQAAFARGEQVACLYFAACDRPAVGTVPNPVLGDVPCCQRCADRVGATIVPPTTTTAGSTS